MIRGANMSHKIEMEKRITDGGLGKGFPKQDKTAVVSTFAYFTKSVKNQRNKWINC